MAISLAPALPPGSSDQPEEIGPGCPSSYLVLLRVGFARRRCHHRRGELLPHHFTLTLFAPFYNTGSILRTKKDKKGGMFLWHFP